MLAARQLETAVSYLADGAWRLFQTVNRRVPAASFQPAWAPAPLPKSSQRSSPALGWPRTTEGLCPTAVWETRKRILSGDADPSILVTEQGGEIKAHILERDVMVIIEKTSPQHGTV